MDPWEVKYDRGIVIVVSVIENMRPVSWEV